VISGLIYAFTANIADNPRNTSDIQEQVEIRIGSGASFVPAAEVEEAAREAKIPPATTDALVSEYEDAQLKALKTAFLFAALLVVVSLFGTRNLPSEPFGGPQTAAQPPPTPAAA